MTNEKFTRRIKKRYTKVNHWNRIKCICNNLFKIDFKISKKHIKELSNG